MTSQEGPLLALIIATWAKTAGLAREEASQLHQLLLPTSMPMSVDQAWNQLEEATLAIRRRRNDHG